MTSYLWGGWYWSERPKDQRRMYWTALLFVECSSVRTGGIEIRRVDGAVDARRVAGSGRRPAQVVLERRVAPERAAERSSRLTCACAHNDLNVDLQCRGPLQHLLWSTGGAPFASRRVESSRRSLVGWNPRGQSRVSKSLEFSRANREAAVCASIPVVYALFCSL